MGERIVTQFQSYTVYMQRRKFRIWLICILACTWAVNAAADTFSERFDVAQIPVGDETVAAPYFFDKTGFPVGGVIILTTGEKPWQSQNLANTLSEHGWPALIVTPHASAWDLTTYMHAVVRYLETERGLLNTALIVLDNTFDAAQQVVGENAISKSVRGIILINTPIAPDLHDQTLPVLDISTTRPHPNFVQRRINAKRHKRYSYRQFVLGATGDAAFRGEDQLARRVRGWLAKNLRGMELDKRL